jgi:hypothetical protein
MAALCGCLSTAICLVACAMAEMGPGTVWIEHAIAGFVTALFSLLAMR